jgi:hypothetical protein
LNLFHIKCPIFHFIWWRRKGGEQQMYHLLKYVLNIEKKGTTISQVNSVVLTLFVYLIHF